LSSLLLFACGRALGADIPGTFYLMAAMPAAFHLLVLARVYDVRPALVRLLVVGSTVPAVVAVALGVALLR
jgi:predicted permease